MGPPGLSIVAAPANRRKGRIGYTFGAWSLKKYCTPVERRAAGDRGRGAVAMGILPAVAYGSPLNGAEILIGLFMNPFDSASPFDARYYFADAGFYARLHPYVSEK